MQQELLDTSNTTFNIEDEPNRENSTLVRREAIDGTPFYLIHKDGKWFVTFAQYRMTEEMDGETTPEKALEHMEQTKWLQYARLAIITHELIAKEAVRAFEQK